MLSGIVFFPSDDLALQAVDLWRPIPRAPAARIPGRTCPPACSGRAIPRYRRNARAALLVEQNLRSEDDEEVEAWTRRLHERQALEDESWFGLRAADRERFREFRHVLPVTVIDTVRRNGFPKFGTDLPFH